MFFVTAITLLLLFQTGETTRYTCFQHENTEFSEEKIESKPSGTALDDVATVTCTPGFDMIRCVCKGKSCKGSTIFTDNTGTYCQAWNMGGRRVRAKAICRRLMITCDSPYDKFPIISCPSNYKLVSCQLQHKKPHHSRLMEKFLKHIQTRAKLALSHSPELGDCSPDAECPFPFKCRVSARCIRFRAYALRSDQKKPCKAPTPQTPPVADTTCRGEEYEYTDRDTWDDCNNAITLMITNFVVKNLTECKALCNRRCDCAAISLYGYPHLSSCTLYPIECKQKNSIPYWGYVTYSDDVGFYAKRRKGHPDESRILATSGVPNADWTTCDGKTFAYKILKNRFCDAQVFSEESYASSLAACQKKCDSDCQCRAIEYPRCRLLYDLCPEKGLTITDKIHTYVRYEKGTTPDLNTRKCQVKEYEFHPVQYKRRSGIKGGAYYHQNNVSLSRCKELCQLSCYCGGFVYSTEGRKKCTLYDNIQTGRPLLLLSTGDKQEIYYVKTEIGVCPTDYRKNCKNEKYEYERLEGKVICPSSYIIRAPTRDYHACQTLCDEHCDCEAYLRHRYDELYDDDNDVYNCTLYGRGCVKKLKYDDFFDELEAKLEAEYEPYGPSFYRTLTKKIYMP